MFCENCGTEIDENMKYCPKCGNVLKAVKKEIPEVAVEPKEKKSLGSRIKMVGNVLGTLLFIVCLLYVGRGLSEGKSLSEVIHPSQVKRDPEASYNSSHTVTAVIPTTNDNSNYTKPEDDSAESVGNQTKDNYSEESSEMLMTAEDWEGTYRRDDGTILTLHKNDKDTLYISIADKDEICAYIDEELAVLSENGTSVIYEDDEYNISISYSTGYDGCIITQFNEGKEDFSGLYEWESNWRLIEK